MKTLNKDYTVEVDTVDKDSWSSILQKFDDANLYQTWSYGAIRWGESNISHLVIKHFDRVISAAQIILVKIPLVNKGIAYVSWGPLWRLRGKEEDFEVLRQMIRVLREEYSVKRSLLIRLSPNIIDDATDRINSILNDEGFVRNLSTKTYRTFLLDLSPSLEELRKGLKQKWRNQLNRAERNELKLIEGTEDGLLVVFDSIYKEMLDRKKYVGYIDMSDYRLIQKDLPNPFKMKIMVCEFEGEPMAAIVCCAIGNTGIYLLGATSNNGMKMKGSYLLQWKMIELLKENGFQWYDLGGIDPVNTPGTYHFKAGLAKSGKDLQHIGQFETCENLTSFILVKCGDFLRTNYRKIKERLKLFVDFKR